MLCVLLLTTILVEGIAASARKEKNGVIAKF
jgi:hypothetical protein